MNKLQVADQTQYQSNYFDIELLDRVAHIKLNRPEKRNSMTTDFWNEFPEIISKINEDGDIRVIILSSTGPHFCSGLDLSLFQSDLLKINQEQQSKPILLTNYIEILQKALNILQDSRIPVIAAIQGACIGGGLDLVCASDIRLGTKDCHFSILETKLGLVADIGTFPRLVKLIPDGLVRELAFTGRNFNSEEAKLSGFLNDVYPNQKNMLKAAFELAKEISAQTKLGNIFSVIGGGDTVSVINKLKLFNDFNFVSTAGGAFLEYLEGKDLPGIKSLNYNE